MSTATVERPRLRRRPEPAAPSPSTAAPVPAPPNTSANFTDHFVKVSFETHTWTGRRKARGVEATFAGRQLDEDRVDRPMVCLLPRELELNINRARAACYAAFDLYSLPCDQAGTRLLGLGCVQEAVAAIDAAVAQFHAVADEAAARFGEIVEHNRAYWRPRCLVDASGKSTSDPLAADTELSERRYEETIGVHLPETAGEFRKAFRAEYRLAEPADIAARFQEKVVREFFTAARANAQRHADELVRMVTEEPIRRLADELRSLHGRLTDQAEGRRLDPRSLSGVGAAIKLLLSCGQAIHPGMLREVERLDGQLATTLQSVEDAHAAGSSYTEAIRGEAPVLLDAISRVVELAEERRLREEMQQRYGVSPKRVRLD